MAETILNPAMRQLLAATTLLLLFSCLTSSNKLNRKTETVEFYYVSWACACANWATLSDINKYQDTGKLSDHCVFVEPANQSLALNDTLGYNGDIVQFTGQYYVDKGFPKDYVENEEPVEKAKVFRYTSYKIIKSNYRESVNEMNK